jgi:hypothetical protein
MLARALGAGGGDVGRGWRGELPAARIQEAAGEVLSLHALLGRLESDSPCR